MNYGYKPTWLSRGAHTVQWTCFFYKGVIPPKSVLIVFSWHYRLACWNHTAPYRHQPFLTMEIVVKALPHEIVTLSHGTSGTFILCSTSFFYVWLKEQQPPADLKKPSHGSIRQWFKMSDHPSDSIVGLGRVVSITKTPHETTQHDPTFNSQTLVYGFWPNEIPSL